MRSHCSSSDFRSCFNSRRSFDSLSCSPRIWISSSFDSDFRRRFRMASACTSVSLKRVISLALGSSSKRTMRMTSSRLRKGNGVAAEPPEPMLDALEAELGALNQPLDAVLQPLAQHVAQVQDAGDL